MDSVDNLWQTYRSDNNVNATVNYVRSGQRVNQHSEHECDFSYNFSSNRKNACAYGTTYCCNLKLVQILRICMRMVNVNKREK